VPLVCAATLICLVLLLRRQNHGREVFLARAECSILATLPPRNGLLLGLVITLAAVLAYAVLHHHSAHRTSGKLQSEMVDRNRKDSLQLLRVQNDLNSIALGHAGTCWTPPNPIR